MTARRQAGLAQAYDEARPRLVRVAYAVLGSNTDAEDVVSDGWPRLIAADDREPILDLGAWATLTVRPVGVGPAAVGEGAARAVCRALAAGTDRPGDRRPRGSGDARQQVSFAPLVVLETLSPAERTAWVLHDLFGVGFTEVADIVGRTRGPVRPLAARAPGAMSPGCCACSTRRLC